MSALIASSKLNGNSETGFALFAIVHHGRASGIARPCQSASFWPFLSAESAARESSSASCYNIGEDVGIVPIVMSVLKSRKVKREIIHAHLVVGSDHSALEQAPEVINILSEHCRARIPVYDGSQYHARSRLYATRRILPLHQ
jgi:hypothetical protein